MEKYPLSKQGTLVIDKDDDSVELSVKVPPINFAENGDALELLRETENLLMSADPYDVEEVSNRSMGTITSWHMSVPLHRWNEYLLLKTIFNWSMIAKRAEEDNG